MMLMIYEKIKKCWKIKDVPLYYSIKENLKIFKNKGNEPRDYYFLR